MQDYSELHRLVGLLPKGLNILGGPDQSEGVSEEGYEVFRSHAFVLRSQNTPYTPLSSKWAGRATNRKLPTMPN